MYCTVVCQMIDLSFVPLLNRTITESKKLTQYYEMYSALYLTRVFISSKGVHLLYLIFNSQSELAIYHDILVILS